MTVRRNLFLVVLIFLGILNREDAEVCVLKHSCILPCSFQPGDDVVIHWIQVQGNIPVHSYYHHTDQLASQNERFKSRTSLFKDQISKGNASLRLMGVEIQDQARYQCYTSTITGNKELFVDLNVEAPARKVNIEQEGDRITCSSEGIYPEPKLTWSTNPPSSINFTPRVQQTDQQLFKINSSLILSDSVPDLDYICTISSGTNRRTATLFKPTSISGCTTETTISCTASDTSLSSSSPTWTFNHTQIILRQNKVSENWKQHVKDVTKSPSLKLEHLSSDQEGTYTCELIINDETHINTTILKTIQDCSSNSAGVAAGVAVGCVLVPGIVGVAAFFLLRKRIRKRRGTRDAEPTNRQKSDPQESAVLKPNNDAL